ncbi:chaplin family protein [Streptomyces sp. NPDC006872]
MPPRACPAPVGDTANLIALLNPAFGDTGVNR